MFEEVSAETQKEIISDYSSFVTSIAVVLTHIGRGVNTVGKLLELNRDSAIESAKRGLGIMEELVTELCRELTARQISMSIALGQVDPDAMRNAVSSDETMTEEMREMALKFLDETMNGDK